MGAKKRNSVQLNWNATTPIPFVSNSPLSGVLVGAMASTNVIYSNIQDISNTDNQGLEISWTGTPTGLIEIQCSESGQVFNSLTFDPVITQPAGASGNYLVSLNQVPWRYLMVKYTNTSGTGSLSIYVGSKDLN